MNRHIPFLTGLMVLGILLILLTPLPAQEKTEDERILGSFKSWILTGPEELSLKAYEKKLADDGVSQAEIQHQVKIIRRILTENPEMGIEISYDLILGFARNQSSLA